MTYNSSQEFESYLPVYDTVPETWEEGRQFLIEHLKKISNAVNNREIAWLLDEQLLTGQRFIPGTTMPQQYRSVLRKVIDFSPLNIGVNTKAHGIVVDANFTLMHLYAGATNTGIFTYEPIPNGSDTISGDATNIIITVTAAWQRAFAVIEYIQEL